MEVFWKTIAQYNEGTWIAQIVITVVGILLTILLYQKPTLLVKRLMKGYMVFLNSWISIVYYMIYCGDRNYNYILAIFWGIIALIWLWDLITNYTPFERYHKYDKLTYILYAMPFLYPLLSWARGMEFPMMTTCVMPCSVAVFTIGLLLAFSRKVNLLVILFLCHWALIAFSKVYVYKIPEDLLLASATVPAIYLFFKNYFDQNLHMKTKPSAKYANWILIALLAIGIFLEYYDISRAGRIIKKRNDEGRSSFLFYLQSFLSLVRHRFHQLSLSPPDLQKIILRQIQVVIEFEYIRHSSRQIQLYNIFIGDTFQVFDNSSQTVAVRYYK